MVRKIFKKRKDNQNKIKPSGRKRKIFATIALTLSLLFGKPRLSSSQSSSPNFGNQEVHQRLNDDREFNLVEGNDQQVILAKGDSNPITPPTNRGPSNFPTQSSGGRPRQPSRPATGTNPYRTPSKLVDQGLGAAANPAGAGNGGGAAEFDDQWPVSKKQQSQESKFFDSDYRSNDPKKKKKSEDQCPINEQNKAGFKELPDSENFSYNMDQGRGLKKQAQKVWKNPKVKQEVLRMLKRFGDENANIQEKPLKGFKNLTELKNSGPGPRIFIYRGKNEQPVVVGFCMRDDLDATLDKLKGKFI